MAAPGALLVRLQPEECGTRMVSPSVRKVRRISYPANTNGVCIQHHLFDFATSWPGGTPATLSPKRLD
jgi:hypothetical protein